MSSGIESSQIRLGPAPEPSLRVSVATLTRVAFPSPSDDELMLAFEHKATLLADGNEPRVEVMAQPLGGALRFRRLSGLQRRVERFQFDSGRSRLEQDFRIFIDPSDWETVRDYCLQELAKGEESDLESNPERELVEEFEDALGVTLLPPQYALKPLRIVLENKPRGTQNVHAPGFPTVRMYKIFEAQVVDAALCQLMVANSANRSAATLREMAIEDARQGGLGRANAILVAPKRRVCDAYSTLPIDARSEPLSFEGSIFNGNVPAVLDGIVVPAFETVSIGFDGDGSVL
jgi:hypothetical protein